MFPFFIKLLQLSLSGLAVYSAFNASVAAAQSTLSSKHLTTYNLADGSDLESNGGLLHSISS
jgi:hypothetical protein